MLFMQDRRAAASRTFCRPSMSKAMRIAMIAMTTSSSSKENACRFWLLRDGMAQTPYHDRPEWDAVSVSNAFKKLVRKSSPGKPQPLPPSLRWRIGLGFLTLGRRRRHRRFFLRLGGATLALFLFHVLV